MVAIDISQNTSDDDDDTPSKIPEKSVMPRVRKSRAKMESGTAPKLAALHVKPTPKAKVRVQVAGAVKAESSGTFNFTPPSHADVKNLPAFMASTWASKFLQGTYLAFSKAPKAMTFVTTADAAGTVAVLQEVLDDLYPGCGWEITWGDAICAKAVARIGERRGAFGRSGLAAVDEEFKMQKYFGSLDGPEAERGVRLLSKIQADAKYALRSNGPGLFRRPTPENHTLSADDPGYIKPTGFLESHAFVATVKPFIKGGNFKIVLTQDGAVDLTLSVLPFGACVLGAVSVERGYKCHLIDRRKNSPPEFSATIYANAAAGYLKSIRKMSPNRWENILAACGASTTSVDRAAAASELDTLDGAREMMYCPSSPVLSESPLVS
ncbi:hypothetical protein K438DRAFT_1880114 [Mycena galopus ATCC 62051]|nr:hypothetical protein K438DRAFT_1880114 [Mycena galopus ATCC 62051]